jgi:hypothetical protein
LAQEESEAIKAGNHKLAAKIIGARDFLATVAVGSRRTGSTKQAIFKRVARELAEEMSHG